MPLMYNNNKRLRGVYMNKNVKPIIIMAVILILSTCISAILLNYSRTSRQKYTKHIENKTVYNYDFSTKTEKPTLETQKIETKETIVKLELVENKDIIENNTRYITGTIKNNTDKKYTNKFHNG
jgi:hypothetical protein